MQFIMKIGFIVMGFFLLTGCFQGEQSQNEIDLPPSSKDNIVETNATTETNTNQDASTILSELYLLDSTGMIAPQLIEIPLSISMDVASQSLQYLVREGPISSMLPNGFQAVLPVGTEVLGMDLLEDGTLMVDLSEEFTNYEANEELRILQAMTYTLTQFDNVERIKLKVAGNLLTEMPVNGTPIENGYSRVNGINIQQTDNNDFLQSDVETIYYPAQYNDISYFVPVTQYLPRMEENQVASVVNSLLDNSKLHFTSNIIHVFHPDVLLTESPMIKDGTVTLHFNEMILKDVEEFIIADEVIETLVRTLTELPTIDAVEIMINNNKELRKENGELYNMPVKQEHIQVRKKL